MQPHKVPERYANFDLQEPPLKFALNHAEHCGQGSRDHLRFVVDRREVVAATKTRMESAGLTTFSEEEVACCYATQDKVWVTDPDGHSWEVYVLLDDRPSEEALKTMTMLPAFREPGDCCGG